MDASNLSDFDLEKLNEKDKNELRQFLNTENQKARLQSSEFPYRAAGLCLSPVLLRPSTDTLDLVVSA
jgi:hypothetical protein